MQMQTEKSWFVAVVEGSTLAWQSGKFGIERKINDLGFSTFVPWEERTEIKRNRRIKAYRPVFGPYIFVQFDRQGDEWGALRAYDDRHGDGIKGFIDILKNNNVPMRIPDMIISKIKNAFDLGLFNSNPLPKETPVEIMEGPFAGLIGIIKSTSKKRRVKVLLKHLGLLDLDPAYLRKV